MVRGVAGFCLRAWGPGAPNHLLIHTCLHIFALQAACHHLDALHARTHQGEAKQLPEQLPTLLLGALNPILYCRSPLGKPYSIIKAHSYGSSAFCVYLLQDEGSCTRSVQTEFHGLEEKLV